MTTTVRARTRDGIERNSRVVTAPENSIGAQVFQGEATEIEERRIDRLVEMQRHPLDVETGIQRILGEQHRRGVIGQQAKREHIRERGISAGIRGAHLDGHARAARGDGRGVGQEIEGRGDIARGHLPVDEQIDARNLDIIRRVDGDGESASLEDLRARRIAIEIGDAAADRNRGRLAARIIGQEVDDLKAANPISDDRQSGGHGHVEGRRGQRDAIDES